MPAKLTAASYERVSTRVQGQSGFSLGAQAKDVVQYAADRGWALPEPLRFRDGEDRHASGADWDLPGLNAMLDAAKRSEFSVLIVPAVDRFARDMTKALVLEQQLKKYGVRVVYLSAEVDDTAEGRLLLRQLQSFAEYEREKIAFRTMRGRREKVERGLVLGSGPAPYGYCYVRAGDRSRIVALEPDPNTAPVVQRIFREALSRPAAKIADILNRDAVPSPAGKRWTQPTVARILTNPTYCGRVLYAGQGGRARARAFAEQHAINGVAVPDLVSVDDWQAVQQATELRHLVRGARKSGPDPFLLRGLLVCGHCGGRLSVKWNSFGGRTYYRQYHCSRSRPFLSERTGQPLCQMRDVRADELETAVWDVVTRALGDPHRFRGGIAAARQQHRRADTERVARVRTLEKDLRKARAKIDRIVDELLETPKGTQSYRALVERQRQAEMHLSNLEDDRAQLDKLPVSGLSELAAAELELLAERFGAAAEQATQQERRAMLEALRLAGTITLDKDGQRFGRRHRYRVELQAVLDLGRGPPTGHRDTSLPNPVSRYLANEPLATWGGPVRLSLAVAGR